jgi:hypothetical protein
MKFCVSKSESAPKAGEALHCGHMVKYCPANGMLHISTSSVLPCTAPLTLLMAVFIHEPLQYNVATSHTEYVGSEVLTAVVMKRSSFWNICQAKNQCDV